MCHSRQVNPFEYRTCTDNGLRSLVCLFRCFNYVAINNFSVMLEWFPVSIGWTSTKAAADKMSCFWKDSTQWLELQAVSLELATLCQALIPSLTLHKLSHRVPQEKGWVWPQNIDHTVASQNLKLLRSLSLPRILVTTIPISLSVPLNPIMGQFMHSPTSTDRNKFCSFNKTYIWIRVCIFDVTVSVCDPRFIKFWSRRINLATWGNTCNSNWRVIGQLKPQMMVISDLYKSD